MIKNLFFTLCAALCLCFTTQETNAQVWDNGDGMLHVGFGLGGISYGGVTNLPSVAISYDQALKSDLGPGHLSVGGIFGYKVSTGKDFGIRNTYTNTFIGARCLYHWDRVNSDKWDLYAGVVLAARLYRYSTDNELISNVNSFFIFPGTVIGGHYFFTKRLAVFGELGYSVGYFNAGVSLKL